MYTELADWFHLLTAPEEYTEEADFYLRMLKEAAGALPSTLLELGSGGGNNAWHYKRHVKAVTLTDLRMLALSQSVNPECTSPATCALCAWAAISMRLFVHDAVVYMTTEDDLRRGMATAFAHCRPGGVALFAPDHVRNTFEPTTEHGGHDGQGRALRYLEWTSDADPTDSIYQVDYAYLLHEDGKPVRGAYDQHVCGLFARADWLRLLEEVGFRASVRPFEHSEVTTGTLEVFLGVKPE